MLAPRRPFASQRRFAFALAIASAVAWVTSTYGADEPTKAPNEKASAKSATPAVPAIAVRKLGDAGWKAEDCRSNDAVESNDLVGPKSSQLAWPAKKPVASDDAVIASMIRFEDVKRGAPEGATLDGAVLLATPEGGSVPLTGKVTISVVDTDKGFASGEWHKDFSATYRWFGVTQAPLLKIAVRSPKWGGGEGQSQHNHKLVRTGDGSFDLVLVLELNDKPGEWRETKLSATEGKWHIFNQHGNKNLTKPPFNDMRTLDEWAQDPVYGPLLFGEKTKVVNVQFGIGSGYVGAGYVDWLETSLLNKGGRIDFAGGEPLVTPVKPANITKKVETSATQSTTQPAGK